MKTTYIQDRHTGELINANDCQGPQTAGFFVIGDIQPYQSMVDGQMIMSRSHHREHLRSHGLTEIGNETKYLKAEPLKSPPGLKQNLIEAMRKVRR